MCVITGVQTGGVVVSYPQGTEGKKTSASFLYNATRSLYEQAGFICIRSKGSHHSVMRKTVPRPARPERGGGRSDERERCG